MTKQPEVLVAFFVVLLAAAARSHIIPGSDEDVSHHIVKKTIRDRRSLTLIENQLHPEYCMANQMFLKPRFLSDDDDDTNHHYHDAAGVEYAVYQNPGEHAWISPVKITSRIDALNEQRDVPDDAPFIGEALTKEQSEVTQETKDIAEEINENQRLANYIVKETIAPIYVPDDAPKLRQYVELEKSDLTEETKDLKAQELPEIENSASNKPNEIRVVNLEDKSIEWVKEPKFVERHYELDDNHPNVTIETTTKKHHSTTAKPATKKPSTTRKPTTTTTKKSPITTETDKQEDIGTTTEKTEIKIESRGGDEDKKQDSKNGNASSSGKSSSSLSSSLL